MESKNNSIELSVVIPIFNEEGVIEQLVQRLTAAVNNITDNYEMIFVNDGSKDTSLQKLKKECDSNPRLHFINLSRNFGHQNAIVAGLNFSSGNAIVTIDGDLQDPPELISELYKEYLKGNKVVYAKRTKRKGEPFLRLFAIKMFYRIMAALVSFEIPLDVGDFRLISRDVLEYLKKMKEYDIYLRGQVAWLGFKSTYVQYERDERKHGKSNYPFRKLLRLAYNGITSFSDAPLKLATSLGFIVCTISFFIGMYAVYSYYFKSIKVPGWASTLVTITFLGGVQLLSIGIIGEYISRIINNVRQRPQYVIEETDMNTTAEKQQ